MLKGVSDYIGFSVTCNRIFLLFPKEKIRILLIPGTGNGERGTGVWERVYSGNLLENSKWRTKEKKGLQAKQFE